MRPPADDPYSLYEAAAQDPARTARFLDAVHGGPARALGEDFCGSGAISRAWAALGADRRAICVDRDNRALDALRARITDDIRERIATQCDDVLDVSAPVDVIAALNFPVGYFHERGGLLSYFGHARSRLLAGGVLVVDIYGGADAFLPGETEEELTGGITYIWDQRRADPIRSRVENAMHFVLPGGRRFENAFTYDWRLWSPAELRDAMLETGFDSVDVYDRLGDALDSTGRLHVTPVGPWEEMDDTFVVYVVGRVRGEVGMGA